MWLDILPTFFILTVSMMRLRCHRGCLVLQLYILIATCYLNIFPTFNYILYDGEGSSEFGKYQWLVGMFFQFPLLIILHIGALFFNSQLIKTQGVSAKLSVLLPIGLAVMLISFWGIALGYDIFFRRIGFTELMQATSNVPSVLLYIYRSVVETSFFVIAFLLTTLRIVRVNTSHYLTYKILTCAYVVTFLIYFLVNSRMQLILIFFTIACTQPRFEKAMLGRSWLRFVALLSCVVLALTLLREVVLEDSGRIDISSLLILLRNVAEGLAERLDALKILCQIDGLGFDPFGFNLIGISHFVTLHWLFFVDATAYQVIKEDLTTSPSVVIVNQMLPIQVVDFPKAVILDMFLSFGVLGLLSMATLLSVLLIWMQRCVKAPLGITPSYILAIYMLPIILAFENEFLASFFSFLKWLPVFMLVCMLRPRFDGKESAPHKRLQVTHQ